MNNSNQLFEEIEKYIDSDMKYIIGADGGKIRLISVEDNIVTIQLFGACSRCAAKNYTLYNVVQPMIKDKFPMIEEVVLV